MRAKGQTESEVLREMVAAGLFYNRVADTVRDEARKRVQDQQKKIVEAALAPLIQRLDNLDEFTRVRATTTDQNMHHINRRVGELQESSGLLMRAVETLMYNVVHIRVGMWNFVTTLYYRTISKLPLKATQEELLGFLREHATNLKASLSVHDLFDEAKLTAKVERAAQEISADLTRKVASE